MRHLALCWALTCTLVAAERIQPGTLRPKPTVSTKSQVYMIGGAAADMWSSWYVTRRLEARGWTVAEKSPVYGQRFDTKDVAIGAGIVAGVLILQRIKPDLCDWSKVNWVVGSIRYGVAANNIRHMR